MKKLVFLLLIVGAVYQFRPDLFSSITGGGVYQANGEAAVVLGVFNGCGQPCQDAVRLLDSKGLAYEALNLSDGPEVEARYKKLGGSRTLPFLFVGEKKVQGYQRTDYTHALAQELGLQYLDAGQRSIVARHFDGSGNAKLVMYGASWCPQCKRAREFFQAKSIPFVEIDVEKSAQDGRDFKRLEAAGYPLIYVGAQRMVGFDESVFMKMWRNRS